MADVTSGESGVTLDSKRWTTLPLRSTRNLVKFHLMSPGVGWVSVFGQVLIKRRLVVSLDRNLDVQGKVTLYFPSAKGLDFFVGAGFLGAEVVGRKANDHKALGFVLVINGFESRVLRSVSALAGDVDHEHDFAFEIGQRHGFAVNVGEGEVVDIGGCESRSCHEKHQS